MSIMIRLHGAFVKRKSGPKAAFRILNYFFAGFTKCLNIIGQRPAPTITIAK